MISHLEQQSGRNAKRPLVRMFRVDEFTSKGKRDAARKREVAFSNKKRTQTHRGLLLGNPTTTDRLERGESPLI